MRYKTTYRVASVVISVLILILIFATSFSNIGFSRQSGLCFSCVENSSNLSAEKRNSLGKSPQSEAVFLPEIKSVIPENDLLSLICMVVMLVCSNFYITLFYVSVKNRDKHRKKLFRLLI